MLKRYQKKKREMFPSPNAFLRQNLQKGKTKCKKNKFLVLSGCLRFVIVVFPDHTHLLVLIISMRRIYPEVVLSFYY